MLECGSRKKNKKTTIIIYSSGIQCTSSRGERQRGLTFLNEMQFPFLISLQNPMPFWLYNHSEGGMRAQHGAFQRHSFRVPRLVQRFSSAFSGYVSDPNKEAGRWINYSGLPLGVNTCTWCPEMYCTDCITTSYNTMGTDPPEKHLL